MKSLSQAQFFVAGMVLVLVLALVAILAVGLHKYEQAIFSAEEDAINSMSAIPPSTPEAIVEELRREESVALTSAEADIAAENAAIEMETRELTSVTQSYE